VVEEVDEVFVRFLAWRIFPPLVAHEDERAQFGVGSYLVSVLF